MSIWKPAARLTEEELARRTAPGTKSEGARIARLPGGERLTYWEFGDPAGAPIVALHGMGVSGLMYSGHNHFFRERGLRCIAPNIIGGLADPAPSSRMVDFAANIPALADHLGIDRFKLVAVSYGTLVALALTATAPRRVEHVGLFGALLPGRWMAGRPELTKGARRNEAVLWSTASKRPWLLYPMTALFGLYPTAVKLRSFVDSQLSPEERAMLRPGQPFHASAARLFEECGQRGYGFMALGAEVGWGRDPGFTIEDVAASGVPLFLSTGTQDNAHLPAMAQYLREHVSGSILELVPGLGRFGCMGPFLEEGMARFLALGPAPVL
jgi:pimeloyl-ACP methyl ester carboxylesterase